MYLVFSSLFGIWLPCYCYFECWRSRERKRLANKAMVFATNGFIEITDAVTATNKRDSWDILLPRLIEYWEGVFPGFSISDRATWPIGVQRSSSYREKVPDLPKLIMDSYEVQAIMCALFDPNISLFHFGEQSHWRLRMLISPIWAISPSSVWAMPSGSIKLHGVDQSWHLPNWPEQRTEQSFNGEVPNGTHIDGGQNGLYERKGVPCSPEEMTWYRSTDEQMLAMSMWQSSILFHCETPGFLSKECGATGFHKWSHIIVLEALRRVISSNNTSFMGIKKSLKEWGRLKENSDRLHQIEFQETSQFLVMGTLAHTAMFASALMSENCPRIIQNCKIHADDIFFPVRDKSGCLRRQFVATIPRNSILAKMYTSPLSFLKEKLYEANVKYIEDQITKMAHIFEEHALSDKEKHGGEYDVVSLND